MTARRPDITWKTKYAAALALWGGIPYTDAKQMTEDQIISLFHVDHSIYFESGHADRNKFWNLAPMLIGAHRTKTKADAAIIAKGRRIRGAQTTTEAIVAGLRKAVDNAIARKVTGPQQPNLMTRNRLRSRGFDTTHVRHFDGTVTRRKPHGKKAR